MMSRAAATKGKVLRWARPLAIIAMGIMLSAGPGQAEDLTKEGRSIAVRSDVIYGQGVVGASSAKPTARNLLLDVYQPLEGGKAMAGRPAVILAFGGAFLRGSKGSAHFEEDGANDSSMADYCSMLARAGYVCLAMEYRLATEDPVVAKAPDPALIFAKEMLANPVTMNRIEVVRGRMGLPPLDDASRAQFANTIFAAAEDMTAAVGYARSHAAELGIDPGRIAIGGFSAGAVTAANVAYGMGVPVSAVVSLSGGVGGYDLSKTAKAGMPPALIVMGQNDLAGVQLSNRAMVGALARAGVPIEPAWVAGFGHFYPMGSVTLGPDMTRSSLESRMLAFLGRTMPEPKGVQRPQ